MNNEESQAGTKAEQRKNDEVLTSSPACTKPTVICSQSQTKITLCHSFFQIIQKLRFRSNFEYRGIKIMYSSPIQTFNEDSEYLLKQFQNISRGGLKKRLFRLFRSKK